MAIFLIVLLIIALLWPYITRWISRYMARKAEDYLRDMTGMPPRDDKSRGKKGRQSGRAARSGRGESRGAEPIIPKEYAEDVEFTEIKEYSEADLLETDDDGRVYHESQVEDAVFTEIKTRE